jgi:hypothetical protein
MDEGNETKNGSGRVTRGAFAHATDASIVIRRPPETLFRFRWPGRSACMRRRIRRLDQRPFMAGRCDQLLPVMLRAALGEGRTTQPPPRPCGRMMACPQAQRLHRPAYTAQTSVIAARDTSARGAFLRPSSSYPWFRPRHTSSITGRMLSSQRRAAVLGLRQIMESLSGLEPHAWGAHPRACSTLGLRPGWQAAT